MAFGFDANALSGDPKFNSPATGDYTLQSLSTAIDAAAVDAARMPAHDFSGTARPQGARADMGAYEYGNAAPVAPVITSAASATGLMEQAFSYQITASGGPTSYGATGLPAGLSVNTNSGAITGMPDVRGSFAVSISAANSVGTNTAALTIVIAAAAPVPAGLVGWWKLDENAGATAADSSGNGNCGAHDARRVRRRGILRQRGLDPRGGHLRQRNGRNAPVCQQRRKRRSADVSGHAQRVCHAAAAG